MPDVVSSVKDVFERHMPQRLQSKPELVAKIKAKNASAAPLAVKTWMAKARTVARSTY